MAGTTTYYGISYPTSTDYVKDGASAIQTVATGFDSAVAIPTYNAQTGATYTFALTDVGKTVTASNASAQTYTIPPTASVAWAANTTLYVINLGAGVVTFAAGAGVTVTNTTQTLAQYQSARLIRTALNAWTVTPDSGPATGLSLINTTTFTTQSTINFNDVFSASYTNYRIVCNLTGSTDLNLNLRYRVGGVDNSTANSYVRQLLRGISATASSSALADTSALLGSADSTGLTFTADIFNPFETTRTKALNTFLGKSASVADYAALSYFDHNQTTSYTGFSLLTSTGTVTGTISVYGYGK